MLDHFVTAVRNKRQLLNISQEELAAAMCDQGFQWRQMTVSKLENGRRFLLFNEGVALALILGIRIDEVLEPSEPRNKITNYRVAQKLRTLADELSRNE